MDRSSLYDLHFVQTYSDEIIRKYVCFDLVKKKNFIVFFIYLR